MVTEGTASQDRVCAQTSPTSPTTTALPPAQSSKMSLRSAISSGVGTNRELLIARSASRLVWSPEGMALRKAFSYLSEIQAFPALSLERFNKLHQSSTRGLVVL